MYSSTRIFKLLTMTSLKKDTRAALLASKRAIDTNQVSNRDELLRSSAVREKQDLNEKVAYVLPFISVTATLSVLLARMR